MTTGTHPNWTPRPLPQGISRDATGRLVLGDVIVGVNGRPVRREGDLFDVLDSCKVRAHTDAR